MTEKPDSEDDEQRTNGIYPRIRRRDVMKAAGAASMLTGGAGVSAAQSESCDCEPINAENSQCFESEADEDCSYCKIDRNLSDGESCAISGTDIMLTGAGDDCIEVSDPSNEVGDVALKSGVGPSEEEGCECTVHEDVSDGDIICTLKSDDTRCNKDISHITVEVCPPDEPEPDVKGSQVDCRSANATVENVDQITLEVIFQDSTDCPDLVQTFNDRDGDGTIEASIDLTAQARCYCTPEVLNVYEGDDTSGEPLESAESTLPTGFCEPDLAATADCSSASATATFPSEMADSIQDELIDGCPITATLHTDCDEMVEKTFTSADRLEGTDSFEVSWASGTDFSCYCTPTQVSYSNHHGGATLSNQNDSFSLDSCRPDATVDADCSEVTVSIDNDLDGCPIDATLQFTDCPDSEAQTLDASNSFSHTFDVPCYCDPESVVLEWTLLDDTTKSMTVDVTASDAPCEPDGDVDFACDSVDLTGTGVPGCAIRVVLSFADCGTLTEDFTAGADGTLSGSFDLAALDRCYCTPESAEIYEIHPDGSTHLIETETAPADLDCSPDPTVEADCTEVQVSVSNGIEGCPIDATLNYDDCANDSATLDDSNGFSHKFDVPCYCDPESVDLEWDDGSITGLDASADEACAPDVTVTPDCEALSVSGSTVPGCDVEVVVDFYDCSSLSETFTGASDGTVSGSIDLEDSDHCYCTPESYTVYEVRDGDRLGEGTTTAFGDPFTDAEHCEPSFDADFTCDTVTVEATSGLIEDCPVTATLTFVDDCAPSRTVTLSTSNTSDEFDISDLCGCSPDQVTFTDEESGRELDSIDAPELNCVCTEFDDVCKIDEGELEDLCAGEDVTVNCGPGQITFEGADAECRDGELICFNFTSTFEVFRVFVKGGGGRDAGNEYIWECGTFDSDDPAPTEINFETEDQTYNGKLCANEHPKNGKQTGVSHVTFSVCAEDLD